MMFPPERPPKGPKPVRRVIRLFRPYRRQVAVIGVAITLSSGLGVINPLLIREVFDRALFTPDGVHLGLLTFLVGLMMIIPVITGGIGVLQTYLTNRVGQRVMQDLRDQLYAPLQPMSLRFFTSTPTGDTQPRLATNLAASQHRVP